MKGRPVLVGTSSVSESEELAKSLTDYAQRNSRVLVPFVLNARPELAALEADIVAQAGRFCRVTIATNMAGRGTDILLGNQFSSSSFVETLSLVFPEYRIIEVWYEEKSASVCACFFPSFLGFEINQEGTQISAQNITSKRRF